MPDTLHVYLALTDVSPDSVQRFIDQHAAWLAGIFPVLFVVMWCLSTGIISVVGGWSSLSKVYRAQVPFNRQTWTMQSGQMRRFTNYNNILTLGASQEGLYLACMFLFRFMHPPLLIPWREIKVRRHKGWIFEYVTFTMGHELNIPLRVRAKVADRLRHEAGSSWPVEEI
jgi:hypothetical protein